MSKTKIEDPQTTTAATVDNPTMERRDFTPEQMGKYFHHEYPVHKGGKPTYGRLGMIQQYDDGYCQMAQFGVKGIMLPLINAWSGCLFPDHDLDEGDKAALEQVRKAADAMVTKTLDKKGNEQ